MVMNCSGNRAFTISIPSQRRRKSRWRKARSIRGPRQLGAAGTVSATVEDAAIPLAERGGVVTSPHFAKDTAREPRRASGASVDRHGRGLPLRRCRGGTLEVLLREGPQTGAARQDLRRGLPAHRAQE